MKNTFLLITLITATMFLAGQGNAQSSNKDKKAPLVNYDFFEELVSEVKNHRAKRLVSLETFLKESKKSGSVILDTRSKAMYDLKHVKGAIHLNFSDFTQAELDKLFARYAAKNTHIFIYCNNNFYDSLLESLRFQDPAFASKSAAPVNIKPTASKTNYNQQKTLALNIPTYINLYGYGYKNVYELNEFIDVRSSKIAFEGTFDDKH